jgi:uncharacterized protein YoxC
VRAFPPNLQSEFHQFKTINNRCEDVANNHDTQNISFQDIAVMERTLEEMSQSVNELRRLMTNRTATNKVCILEFWWFS